MCIKFFWVGTLHGNGERGEAIKFMNFSYQSEKLCTQKAALEVLWQGEDFRGAIRKMDNVKQKCDIDRIVEKRWLITIEKDTPSQLVLSLLFLCPCFFIPYSSSFQTWSLQFFLRIRYKKRKAAVQCGWWKFSHPLWVAWLGGLRKKKRNRGTWCKANELDWGYKVRRRRNDQKEDGWWWRSCTSIRVSSKKEILYR